MEMVGNLQTSTLVVYRAYRLWTSYPTKTIATIQWTLTEVGPKLTAAGQQLEAAVWKLIEVEREAVWKLNRW